MNYFIYTSQNQNNKAYNQPITKSTDKKVNQSKFEVIRCSWREAFSKREKRVQANHIGFDFTPDWMKTWRDIFKPIG